MYHTTFFDFQNFEFRFLLWRHASGQYFPAFLSVSALLASVSSIFKDVKIEKIDMGLKKSMNLFEMKKNVLPDCLFNN